MAEDLNPIIQTDQPSNVDPQNSFRETLNVAIPEMIARNKIQRDALFTDDDGATITFNIDNSNIHTVTLGGNRTLAIMGGKVGQVFVLRLVQDNSGSRTVTWFSTIKWASSTAPTLTTTGNKIDTFIFLITSISSFTGAVTYDGYIVGQNVG